jgi:polygalacturonase
MIKTVASISTLASTTILLAGCAVKHIPTHEHVFNIKDYGAVNGTNVSSTGAIRRAIADCGTLGGGIVEIPAGQYLTGPFDLTNNMMLEIDEGAVVYFETDRDRYPNVASRWEGLTESGPHPFIWANGLHNVTITGHGTFNGQGAPWWATMDQGELGNARPNRPIRRRPDMLQIKDCTDVRVDGVTFTNAPFWHVHLLYSTNVEVANCGIFSPVNSPNTDALQTDSCRDVLVRDCTASVGDDGFGIKSGRDEEGRAVNRPCEDITYQRCHVMHGHSVCAIGSEESGSVRHIRFLDCTGDGTDNGIRLKSMRGRGGVVEDVVASHFTLTDVRTPIILTDNYVQTTPESLSVRTPLFHNISIDHVTARGAGTCLLIDGLEEQPIRDIRFEDVDLEGTNGVIINYARNISFKNVRITALTNAFTVSNSENVSKTGITFTEN